MNSPAASRASVKREVGQVPVFVFREVASGGECRQRKPNTTPENQVCEKAFFHAGTS
jgi:hypothetical protein